MTVLTRDLKETDKVFVYGTLKEGRSNHRLLAHTEPLGEGATVENYYMIGHGVPYVFPGGDKKVLGEVYQLPDEDTLEALDWLEGHPHHYCRKVIPVLVGDKVIDCWCYLMAQEIAYPYPYLEDHPVHNQIQVF